MLIIATTCLATSTIGLMCSALARRTSTAMVLTYLTLLVLFVVPMGLEWYLRGISSVTDEQLAALTVTSPFSAALGVPMHTTRNEIWSEPAARRPRPGAGADRRERSRCRSGRFSCASTRRLCLGFLGVTYLAFRWRWWRAGGLG